LHSTPLHSTPLHSTPLHLAAKRIHPAIVNGTVKQPLLYRKRKNVLAYTTASRPRTREALLGGAFSQGT
ncbi:Echinoderm microtubule-associated protein-like CG42247, partial [Araneus ventricosus]